MASKRHLCCILPVFALILCVECLYPGSIFSQEQDPGKIPFKIDTLKVPPPRDEKGPDWHQVDSQFTIVQHNSMDDLEKFDRKIEFLPEDYSLKGVFTTTSREELPEKIARKMDALYRRVQEILDMRKRTEKKLRINLYSDKKALGEIHKQLLGRTTHPRAWYVFEINTIFINVNDVNEGMLAHEMAHAIIDNYLTVRAPAATAEILAIYVDTHLFKKTIKVNPLE